jgi:hypothetical protein
LYVKLSGAGLAVSVGGGAFTVKVTFTTTAEPLLGVSVIVPVYVPTASDVGFTETLADIGVLPDPGVIVSQLPPVAATADVKLIGLAAVPPVIDSVCTAGSPAAPT